MTASPSVSARAHWVTIEEQIQPFAPSSVHLAFDLPRLRFRGTTENVGRLTLDVGRALGDHKTEGPFTVELDGQTIANLAAAAFSSGERAIWLARSGNTWSALRSAVPPARKSPAAPGAVQGSVSQSVSLRHRYQGNARGECLGACQGAI